MSGSAGLAGGAHSLRLSQEQLESVRGECRGSRHWSGRILCPGKAQRQNEHPGSPCLRRQRRARAAAAAGPNPEAVGALDYGEISFFL